MDSGIVCAAVGKAAGGGVAPVAGRPATGPPPAHNCTRGVAGNPTDCRGADDQAEFDRQWPKTVAAILKAKVLLGR